MAQSKKFSLLVEQTEEQWTAKIVRKVSNRRTMVSKKKGRFATEAEAQAWGEQTLAEFQQNQAQRNERHAKARIERQAIAEQKAERAEQKAAERRAARAAAQQEEGEFEFDEFDDFEDDFEE
ncbi:DUF3622 domain-containing protein [Ferrimonas senticii]|uniref:DUF3622 domain-containing protein n=1 Tax=Ferrimonas senticii TaxID=394566 RepID=UPI00041903C3|nr:DUF3622 domain-containing protein [Ferrimonas senticii]